ncbi:MAG: hypothetical protein A2Z72_02275 [Omnitrophica bacterium RBG_13_46_9]|nr:MAG: hypothetical protein A2Z72_02275 [Omnitrophica bacterium RBG_13_46_9]
MVKSANNHNNKKPTPQKNGKFFNNNGAGNHNYKRLLSMGKLSMDIINKLYNPIDATNRFLNLALQTVEEDSQSRQFILESKSGIREMHALVKRLDGYAKGIEKEINKNIISK